MPIGGRQNIRFLWDEHHGVLKSGRFNEISCFFILQQLNALYQHFVFNTFRCLRKQQFDLANSLRASQISEVFEMSDKFKIYILICLHSAESIEILDNFEGIRGFA